MISLACQTQSSYFAYQAAMKTYSIIASAIFFLGICSTQIASAQRSDSGQMISQADITVESLRRIIGNDYYKTSIDQDGDLKLEGRDGSVIYVTAPTKDRTSIKLFSSWGLQKSSTSSRTALANRLNNGLVMGNFYIPDGLDKLYTHYYITVDGPLNAKQFLATLDMFRRCSMSASERKYDIDGLVGTGKIFGVGIVFHKELGADGYPTVDSVVEGGPAQAAGIKSGDVILSVNGTALKGMQVDEVTRIILDSSVKAIKLTLQSDGGNDGPAEVSLLKQWFYPK